MGSAYQQHLPFAQTPYLSPDEMRMRLSKHFPLLWRLVDEPWQELLTYRATDSNFTRLREEEIAAWITTQAAHVARETLAERPEFRLVERHNKLVVVVEDEFALAIKKLTRRRNRRTGRDQLTRSNYPTRANCNFWDQRVCEVGLDLPRVILGYQLIREATDIRIGIAYPRSRGKGIEWVEWLSAPAVVSQPGIFLPISDSEEVRPVEDTGDRGFVIEDREADESGNHTQGGAAG